MCNREVLPVADLFDMSQSKFMRKGIIGDWRNHFSAEESAQFDRLYADRLREIGLDLAYDHEEAERMIAQNGGRIVRVSHESWLSGKELDLEKTAVISSVVEQ